MLFRSSLSPLFCRYSYCDDIFINSTLYKCFGILDIADTGEITSFREKDGKDGGRINAGYMVMNPEIFDYIDGDTTVFEQEPLERIVEKGELMAYQFDGYWQCMDTKREMERLKALWDAGSATWKVWEE